MTESIRMRNTKGVASEKSVANPTARIAPMYRLLCPLMKCSINRSLFIITILPHHFPEFSRDYYHTNAYNKYLTSIVNDPMPHPKSPKAVSPSGDPTRLKMLRECARKKIKKTQRAGWMKCFGLSSEYENIDVVHHSL
jgi:hypothetical protein